MKEGDFLVTKIPRNINDLSQKGIMNLFQDKEISLFGFNVPKIVESLNVELQDIKIEERRTDLVFLLEDDSLLHLEFQTNYNQRDLPRFMMYDLLLHEQHKRRKVITVIIYAAGVKRRELVLDFDTLVYRPHVIFLEEMDGEKILNALEEKFLKKQLFSDEDILNLLFNCFMKSGILEPAKRAARLIKVADTIEDPSVREMAKAATLGVIGKFLPLEQMMKLSEVLKMIDPLEAMIKIEVAKEVSKEKFETAKKMLEEGISVESISKITNLSLDTIKDLQLQL